MNTGIIKQVVEMGATPLIALFVWRYYRRRTFPVTDRYLTFGPRFWAGFVDSFVLCPVGFVTSAVLSHDVPGLVAAFLIILEHIAWFVYTVVMHARYGQTVGKMVTKVRVVDYRTEGKISWLQAWLREGIPMLLSMGFLGYSIFVMLDVNSQLFVTNELFWLFTALPGLWFVAEVMTMLTNKKRRALHDFIAGTVVVRRNTDERSDQSNVALNDNPTALLDSSGVVKENPSVS